MCLCQLTMTVMAMLMFAVFGLRLVVGTSRVRGPHFWGLSSDVPVPADYDGDGKAEITVFRPGVGGWYSRAELPPSSGVCHLMSRSRLTMTATVSGACGVPRRSLVHLRSGHPVVRPRNRYSAVAAVRYPHPPDLARLNRVARSMRMSHLETDPARPDPMSRARKGPSPSGVKSRWARPCAGGSRWVRASTAVISVAMLVVGISTADLSALEPGASDPVQHVGSSSTTVAPEGSVPEEPTPTTDNTAVDSGRSSSSPTSTTTSIEVASEASTPDPSAAPIPASGPDGSALPAEPEVGLSCPGYPASGGTAKVIALGDSYSAGEGLDCYDPSTDVDGSNQCHRSDHAYSSWVQPEEAHRFVACSGAVIKDLFSVGQWGEQPQVNAIGTSADTVLMTIGGNDVGFGEVVKACVSVRDLHVRGSGCDEALDRGSDRVNGIGQSSIRSRLASAYRQVLARMSPSTSLVVGLYPAIFPEPGWSGQPSLVGRFCVAATAWIPIAVDVGYLEVDMNSMRSLQVQTNLAIRQAVQDIAASGDTRIRLADTVFPDHSISCGDSGRPEPFINGVLAPGAGLANLGDWAKFVSNASFHPREVGQDAMKRAVSGVSKWCGAVVGVGAMVWLAAGSPIRRLCADADERLVEAVEAGRWWGEGFRPD